MRAQRFRVGFGRGAQLRFITHLDLMRFWERALRRAEVDVAYSEGFSPHPQISLAAPLPVGVTSRGELMDVFLAARSTPELFIRALCPQLPPGLAIHSVEEVEMGLPSIQSQMRSAEYEVLLPGATDTEAVLAGIATLLARTEIPWQHKREKEVRSYDLRPLIQSLALCAGDAGARLQMRLRADNVATGRPDQVLAAMGLAADLPIERTGLILASDQTAT